MEPTLKHVTAARVPAVEAAPEVTMEPLHPAPEVRLRRLDQQVHVVAHQAVGQTPPGQPARDLAQAREVTAAVEIVDEDRLTDRSAGEHVVDGAGEIRAQWSRHALDSRPRGAFRPRGEVRRR